MRGSSNTMSKSQLLSRISPARPRMQDLVSPNGAVVNCTFNPQLQSQFGPPNSAHTGLSAETILLHSTSAQVLVVHFLESRDELCFLSRRALSSEQLRFRCCRRPL